MNKTPLRIFLCCLSHQNGTVTGHNCVIEGDDFLLSKIIEANKEQFTTFRIFITPERDDIEDSYVPIFVNSLGFVNIANYGANNPVELCAKLSNEHNSLPHFELKNFLLGMNVDKMLLWDPVLHWLEFDIEEVTSFIETLHFRFWSLYNFIAESTELSNAAIVCKSVATTLQRIVNSIPLCTAIKSRPALELAAMEFVKQHRLGSSLSATTQNLLCSLLCQDNWPNSLKNTFNNTTATMPVHAHVSAIEWDIDLEDYEDYDSAVKELELPDSVDIPLLIKADLFDVPTFDTINEMVLDSLSDMYGFCVNSLCLENSKEN
jgi:hypothetical protein